MPIAKAINAGLRKAMSDYAKVLVFGEDVAQLGGVFRVTEGLHAEFGDSRIFNSPIAESGIVGTAIGLAMRGYRPVAEIQFDGFIFPAFDQITTQLAKMQNRSEGFHPMPVVIRVPFGGGIGAVEHHSESPEAYFAHTPGLRVVTPSNANDAYWMIQQSIASTDPVMFFEPKRRYWQKSQVNLDEAPLDLHSARVVREGTDVTIATYGPMVHTSLQAAEVAASEGISIEVIDLRSLSPIDFPTILASVEKAGRLVTVSEAPNSF
jgi:pyruvate dehydrogenase E1 component beta subunit